MGARLLSLLLLLAVLSAGLWAASNQAFIYRPEAQASWAERHPLCAGRWQSPVHIRRSHSLLLPLPALERERYWQPLSLRIANTGHSVALQLPERTASQPPRVWGAALPGRFQLLSLHFHWGRRNRRGSEHVLSGIRFPLELHAVHRSQRYRSTAEALRQPDGLAVLAFFFQVGERANARLWPLLRPLRALKRPGSSAELRRPLALGQLLNAHTDAFYTYRGSLTSPPCAEAVSWLLFPDPLRISHAQLRWFRRLHADENGTRLWDNFRLLQPLNGRLVYRRVPQQQSRRGHNTTEPHTLAWADPSG